MIAILRGLSPDAAVDVAGVLVNAGFRIIEVPLNSPSPFQSIERIAKVYGQEVVLGAGTVIKAADVEAVRSAGGRLIVAPNLDDEVGAVSLGKKMIWCPGVFSPTEAFRAHASGAHLLKLFPAELYGIAGIKALRAVLPHEAQIAAVGGISPQTLADFGRAGAAAFGIGSALFQASMSIRDIERNAQDLTRAFDGFRAESHSDQW